MAVNRSSNASEFGQILSRLKEVQEKLKLASKLSDINGCPQHNRRKSDGVSRYSSANLGLDADCHTAWLQSYGRTDLFTESQNHPLESRGIKWKLNGVDATKFSNFERIFITPFDWLNFIYTSVKLGLSARKV